MDEARSPRRLRRRPDTVTVDANDPPSIDGRTRAEIHTVGQAAARRGTSPHTRTSTRRAA
jgi:hypothetical protein